MARRGWPVRDDADGAGCHGQRPDGRHGLGRLGARRGLHGQDDLRGRRQRVATVSHRDLARVAGLTLDAHGEPPGRGHRGDHAQVAQRAALGHVHLGVGAQATEGWVDPREVGELLQVRGPGVGGADAVGVVQLVKGLERERSDQLARAHRACAEARSLLGGADEQPRARAELGCRLEPQHGPQRAVVAAAVGHGVHVRARGDDRPPRLEPGAPRGSRSHPAQAPAPPRGPSRRRAASPALRPPSTRAGQRPHRVRGRCPRARRGGQRCGRGRALGGGLGGDRYASAYSASGWPSIASTSG